MPRALIPDRFADAEALSFFIRTYHFEQRRSLRDLERSEGFANGSLSIWCRKAGVTVRTKREAVAISNGVNANHPRGAEHYNWGRKLPETARRNREMRVLDQPGMREKLAAGMAKVWRAKLGPTEQYLFGVLASGGHNVVPQFPVGRYVVDIGFPDEKVAVEVDGKGHATRTRQAHDIKRDAWLVYHGWRVLRVWHLSVFTPAHLVAVLKQYVPDLKLAALLPTQRRGCQYRVLVRDAQTPAGRKE